MPVLYRLVALIAVLLGLVLCGAYIGHLHNQTRQARAEARTAQEALKRTQATLAHREKLRAATGRATASARASLQAAEAAHPDWASTPVPKEVQDALCAHLNCAGPDGLRSTPNDSP